MFSWSVNLTQGSHMGEPRSGWSSRPEWLIAGSGVLGERAASSPLPPAREECCNFPVGSGAEPQKILIFLHIWDPQNVYISILRYLKEQKFLGRLGGREGGPPLNTPLGKGVMGGISESQSSDTNYAVTAIKRGRGDRGTVEQFWVFSPVERIGFVNCWLLGNFVFLQSLATYFCPKAWKMKSTFKEND